MLYRFLETDTDNQASNRPETAQRFVKQSTIFYFQGQIKNK